ncbi:MAG: dihydrofolate reductase [Thermoleophilia bacterium]|nr:dihydrofolate reductase [Thermoleophilia bacterium]
MIRAFIATSRDGFIAGPGDDLSWLPDGHAGEEYGYDAFMAGVGAILMGRRTHDVVAGFGVDWPYGDTPVLVATHRRLDTDEPSVRAVSGTPAELVADACATAGDRAVYVDGGLLIQQVLGAGLLDEMIVTVIPVDLGEGVPLLAGGAQWGLLALVESRTFPSGVEQRWYRRPV